MNDMKQQIDQGRIYYYPDILLTCNEKDKDQNSYFKTSPCLIVEILSPTTAAIDRREKLLAYQKIPSLIYYLLVASDRQHIEYFVRDSEGWQTACLETGETLAINCENYQATLTLEDIYEDVVFD